MTNKYTDAFTNLLALEGRSFNDAVVVSGIDARQLRNGLDRGNMAIGEKLRVGRWAFNGRELLELMIVNRLTTEAWVPVGQAAAAAKIIASHAERLFEILQSNASCSEENARIVEAIVHRDDDGPGVIFHQRGDGWGFFDLDWKRLETGRFDKAHVRLPIIGMISEFLAGCSLAFDVED